MQFSTPVFSLDIFFHRDIEGKLTTQLYNKRDYFTIAIVVVQYLYPSYIIQSSPLIVYDVTMTDFEIEADFLFDLSIQPAIGSNAVYDRQIDLYRELLHLLIRIYDSR
jgi:hypothetical protein